MRGSDVHQGPAKPVTVSFEFFPPKTAAMEASLWDAIRKLEPLSPEFVSVTYGAGGSTRERTHATVARILRGDRAQAGRSSDLRRRDEGRGGQRRARLLGRRRPPYRGPARRSARGAGNAYVPHPGGYINSADLVAGIKRIADFEVSVSAYPEKHPESPSVEADLDMLQAKVDAGATARDHAVLLR